MQDTLPITQTLPQMVKNLPAVRETWVWSLGWEDPLEMGMATHSNILVWRILWIEEPGGLQSMGSQRVRQDWATTTVSKMLLHTTEKSFMKGRVNWRRKFHCCLISRNYHSNAKLHCHHPDQPAASNIKARLSTSKGLRWWLPFFNKSIFLIKVCTLLF